MGVKSMGYFYHVVKRDGLRVVKIGERASAVVSADVDAWIAAKITAAAPVHTSAMGGRP
jgi:predicted DNA-binding transcriptional regulator AlpA